MKEYLCISICADVQDTEDKLNRRAKQGWILVCSYARHTDWLILERDKKTCKECGK